MGVHPSHGQYLDTSSDAVELEMAHALFLDVEADDFAIVGGEIVGLDFAVGDLVGADGLVASEEHLMMLSAGFAEQGPGMGGLALGDEFGQGGLVADCQHFAQEVGGLRGAEAHLGDEFGEGFEFFGRNPIVAVERAELCGHLEEGVAVVSFLETEAVAFHDSDHGLHGMGRAIAHGCGELFGGDAVPGGEQNEAAEISLQLNAFAIVGIFHCYSVFYMGIFCSKIIFFVLQN